MQPFADVYLSPVTPVLNSVQPQQVLIVQDEYLHDRAVLDFITEQPSSKAKYRTGAPVSINYGYVPSLSRTFVGYVHHTEKIDSNDSQTALRVYCIGASYGMKDKAQRVWRNVTSDSVVAEFAARYRFSAALRADSVTMDVLAQHGQSDWAFLVELAKRRGYAFYANGTELSWLPRRISTDLGQVLLFSQQGAAGYTAVSNVLSFRHEIGETIPETNRRTRLAAGVGDDGRTFALAMAPPADGVGGQQYAAFLGEHANELPVHSLQEAADYLGGLQETSRFHLRASARLTGDPRVHQGSTVQLVRISADDDGLWWVSGAKHRFSPGRYTLEVELSRDSLGFVPVATATAKSPTTGRPAVVTTVGSVPSAAPRPVYLSPLTTVPVTGVVDAGVFPQAAERLPVVNGVQVRAGVARQLPAPRVHAWQASVRAVRYV